MEKKMDNAVKALRMVVNDLRESEYLGYNYSNIQAICDLLFQGGNKNDYR